MSCSRPSPPTRLTALDILRGIAVLLVILNHVGPELLPEFHLSGTTGWLYWHCKLFGWTGVDLFFVLSGFLIGGLLLQELDRSGRIDLARFWLRRGFKIWPSYYALLLVLGVTGATGYIDWSSMSHAARSLAIHAFFLQNYINNPNGPTWSLAVESTSTSSFP